MVAQVWQQSSGTGADLVVLHGWGLNANVWQPLLAQLEQHYRVHCVDLPGYGESPWPTDSAVSLSAYVAQLAPHLPEHFHLLGWSMGGLIATAFALEHPQRVRSLTTVASSPRFVEDTNWPGMKASVLTLFQKQLKEDFEKTVARFLAIQAMGSPNARADAKLIKNLVFTKPLPDLQALRGGLKLLAESDLRTQISQLDCPLWRVYGALDTLVPAAAADQVAAMVPGSSHWIVENAAHAPFLNHAGAFVKKLVAFTGN